MVTQPQVKPAETGSIGDIEAIYREQHLRFLRFAVASLGDVEGGRDAVHEAFVRAIRSLGDFRGQGRLESWLWRILVNVCMAEKRCQVGRGIAFRSMRNGNREIYVMNADGSGKRNLTRNPAQDYRPSWSPDGRRIAFVSDRDGRLEAHVMNADGSGQRSLAGSEER